MGGSARITHQRYGFITEALMKGGATLKSSTGMTADELVSATELPRNTVYRMLKSDEAANYGVHRTDKRKQPLEYYVNIPTVLTNADLSVPTGNGRVVEDKTVMTFPKPTTTAEVIALEIYRSALALIPQMNEEALARNWPMAKDGTVENYLDPKIYDKFLKGENLNVTSTSVLLAYIWNLHRHERQYLS